MRIPNHIKSNVVPQLTHYNFCFLFQCDGKRVIMEDFKSSIEIKGHDVLNGLREISHKSKEMISQPPPSWIQKAVYRYFFSFLPIFLFCM